MAFFLSTFDNMRIQYFLFFLLSLSLLSSCKPKEEKQVISPEIKPVNEILQSISEAISKNDTDPNLYFERAKVYHENESFDEAIIDLNKAILLDSLHGPYYSYLSDLYLDYYKSRQALKTIEKGASLLPRDIPTLLKKAEIQFILKMNQPSLVTLDQILRLDPQNAEAYFFSGLNFRETGDLKKAISLFQSAVDVDPDIIDAWIILGDLHDRTGNPDALKYLDNAIQIDSNNIQALHAKAFYLQNHNRILDAITIYKKINRLDPSYSEAYFNTGILYLEVDSFQQAKTHFNIAVKNNPTMALAYYYRGLASEKLSDIDAAKADFQQAINLDPEMERAKMSLDALNK